MFFQYRVNSHIDYRYFCWQRKTQTNSTQKTKELYLENRQARAGFMVSNCYSQNNREDYKNLGFKAILT